MRWRLNVSYAAVHAVYWMLYCVISTFASALLLDRGYSNLEIGFILAAANVTAVILQPLLANVADRSRRLPLTDVLLLAAALLALLALGPLLLRRRSPLLTATYVAFLALHVAMQPLINALCFKLGETGTTVNFGLTRSAGSLFYAVLSSVMGGLVAARGVGILTGTAQLLAVVLVGCFLWERQLYRRHAVWETARPLEKTSQTEEIDLRTFARRNRLFVLLTVGVFGIFFSNAVLNSFMLQIITPLGGDSRDMGHIFFLLAVMEIPTMVFFEPISRRVPCRTLLKLAALTYVVKIAVTWLAPSVRVVLWSQLLQLTSFALFLPAMVRFTASVMRPGEAVRGQALYMAMVTMASVVSSLLGGWILDRSGAKVLLAVSLAFTAAGAGILLATVDRVEEAARRTGDTHGE